MEAAGEYESGLILFDHTDDGFKTATGWALPDERWLVHNSDGSGIIDSGAELFGAHTLTARGKLTTGFS